MCVYLLPFDALMIKKISMKFGTQVYCVLGVNKVYLANTLLCDIVHFLCSRLISDIHVVKETG